MSIVKTPSDIWNALRPIQRRELLQLSLSKKQMDDFEIQETIDFVIFRKFSELKPDLKQSIKNMLRDF